MTSPYKPEKIDALPEVWDSFQTDRELRPIYESSARATSLAGIAAVGLKFAGSLAKQSGQGTLDRVTVSSDSERLIVFSLNIKEEGGSVPRVFGMLTNPSTQLESVWDAFGELIETP